MKRSRLKRSGGLKRKADQPRTSPGIKDLSSVPLKPHMVRPPRSMRPPRQQPGEGRGKTGWANAARKLPCAVCGFTMRHGQSGEVQGHHVLGLSVLKVENVPPALWYDQRNMLPLCNQDGSNWCHARHTERSIPVPRAVVLAKAPRALEFAREVGLDWRFDLEYTEEAE